MGREDPTIYVLDCSSSPGVEQCRGRFTWRTIQAALSKLEYAELQTQDGNAERSSKD